MTEDGRVLSDCPTVYALAIAFGLLDRAELRWPVERLVEPGRAENGYRIATGFAGTPYMTTRSAAPATSTRRTGCCCETECPSWLYPVTMGATTIWERWDSMLPDGTINPGEMTSFNHYALGAVADWMHRVVGGLAPAEPGYRAVRIAPQPGGGLTWAKTSLSHRARWRSGVGLAARRGRPTCSRSSPTRRGHRRSGRRLSRRSSATLDAGDHATQLRL